MELSSTNAFLIAMFLTTLVLLVITKLATDRLVHHHHGQKRDFFHAYPIHPGDIVFLGDSLTDGARWDELFPGLPVKNRGINADLSTGVLARLGDIVNGHPAAIFILIGTNDLPWFEHRADADIIITYTNILAEIQNTSPETRVFIQSIFPRARSYNKRILHLNRELKILAENFGCAYIDIYSKLVDPTGQLRSELTNDGLHLLAAGYRIWVDAISPYIEDLK